MRRQFWIFLAAIWIVSCLSRFPAIHSPWHGLDRELLAAPAASLRSVDNWTLLQMAPGEFLGWWSLAEQRRFSPDPQSFRLVNFFLVSALILFLALILAGEDLQNLVHGKDAIWEILPPIALFAFHPFLNDLVANAFTRPILLAAFWGAISFLLLRRALTGERERPGSLLCGVLFYLLALGCHPTALVVLAALTGPILFQARPVPRNWAVLVLLFLVAVVDLAIGLGLGESPLYFLRPAFLNPVPGEVHTLTLAAAFFPNLSWRAGWLLAVALLFLIFASRFARFPALRPAKTPHRFWSWVFLFGTSSLVFPLWQLPGSYLAGPLLLAFFSSGLIRSLKADSIWPEATTRTAALVCGCAALGFLFLGTIRAWNYNTELTRARRAVSNFPAWPLAWQDLSLALIAANQGEAGRALLVRTAARFPEDLAARLALVEVALKEGKLGSAQSFLDSLRPTAPDRWEVVFYLCALKSRLAELADAAGYCQAAVQERPDSALALNYLATVDLRRQQWPEAEALLRQARRREPRNASVLNNLGYLAEQQQDLDQALAAYRQAVRLDPDQTLYLKNAARVYFQRRQVPEAVAAMDAVLLRDPRDLETHVNLAKLFYQMGDLRRAGAQIEAVRRIAPDSPEAMEMDQLQIKMGAAAGPVRPSRRMR